MKDIIINHLKTIEDKFQVKILYAVEAGSRASGYSSKDSDYDVRFIYVQRPQWYLSIDPQGIGAKKDVIELPINNYLDISGWELSKALRLFRKSNPSLMEMLRSKVIYDQKVNFIDRIRKLESEVFNEGAFLYHYLNMAKNNNRKYLQDPNVKVKMYLHTLRPILACKWVESYKTIPPVDFRELMDNLIPTGELHDTILSLIKQKIAGDHITPRLPIVHTFIENEITRLEEYVKTIRAEIRNPTEQLDDLFRTTLNEAW